MLQSAFFDFRVLGDVLIRCIGGVFVAYEVVDLDEHLGLGHLNRS